jgi:hypothetical protein
MFLLALTFLKIWNEYGKSTCHITWFKKYGAAQKILQQKCSTLLFFTQLIVLKRFSLFHLTALNNS